MSHVAAQETAAAVCDEGTSIAFLLRANMQSMNLTYAQTDPPQRAIARGHRDADGGGAGLEAGAGGGGGGGCADALPGAVGA